MEFDITREVKTDLLNGRAPYVRRGWLHFNAIHLSKEELSFAYDGKVVARLDIGAYDFTANDSVTVELSDGGMKIKIL